MGKVARFEIINPSDHCTVEAEPPVVAAVAILLLGEGAYGARAEDGTLTLPILLFGGDPDATLRDMHGETVDEVMATRRAAVADCLDSIFYGDARELNALRAGLEGLPPERVRKAFDSYNDTARTSLSNIGARARRLAARLRATA